MLRKGNVLFIEMLSMIFVKTAKIDCHYQAWSFFASHS